MRKFFAIIGHPVAHSLSPLFQQAAFDAIRIDAAYLPFDLSPEHLANGLEAFKTLNISGFNVTLPHKESILPFLDRISAEAQEIGAVNTVQPYQAEGQDKTLWSGHNTDGPGFSLAFDRFLEKNTLSPPSHAIVFGAGGSSRAVLWSLARMGIAKLCLVNRTLERALDLLHNPSLSSIPSRSAFALSDGGWVDWLRKAPRSVLVNTLSLHAFKGENHPFPPLESVNLSMVSAMIDLSYPPASERGPGSSTTSQGQTPFLKSGEPFGVPRQNGLGMLLCQGALAFELWTGKKAPEYRMEQCLLERTGQENLWVTL